MNIFIVYHSQTGTTHLLAKAIAEGAKQKSGAHVFLRRIPELHEGFTPGPTEIPTIYPEKEVHVLAKARREYGELPECTLEELHNADALILGSPVHYASPSAATQSFLEHLAPLWRDSVLNDKPCGAFVTSNTLHGGKEQAMTSMLGSLMAFSMIPVGLPFQATYMSKAGSIFGPVATGIATPENQSLAESFGERIAEITFALEFGKKAKTLK